MHHMRIVLCTVGFGVIMLVSFCYGLEQNHADKVIRISGSCFKAINIAQRDFIAEAQLRYYSGVKNAKTGRYKNDYEKNKQIDKVHNTLGWMVDISSYSITSTETETAYIIHIVPTSIDVLGGDGTYEIAKNKFIILKRIMGQ